MPSSSRQNASSGNARLAWTLGVSGTASEHRRLGGRFDGADEAFARTMDASTLHRRRTSNVKSSWHGKAFLVEALVLLAFLVMSLAVLITLFVNARLESAGGERLAQAVHLAQNAAEEFAANPTDAEALAIEQDGLAVSAQLSYEPHESGTLVRAVITVAEQGGETEAAAAATGEAAGVADGADAGADGAGVGVAAAADAAAPATEPLYTLETARYVPGLSAPDGSEVE